MSGQSELSELGEQREECPICLEHIGESNRITTQCGHTFHASCIIQNLHTSPLCPMCRGALDDTPTARQQLDDLDYETMDLLVDSILHGTRSNQRITNNIMIYVDNFINGSIPNNRDTLRRSISSTIVDYVNEFASDYTHTLRDWATESIDRVTEDPEIPIEIPEIPIEIPIEIVSEDEEEEYISDIDLLINYAANACAAAASGDTDAIEFRARVNMAFNLITDDREAQAATARAAGSVRIPYVTPRQFLDSNEREIALSDVSWRVIAAMEFRSTGWLVEPQTVDSETIQINNFRSDIISSTNDNNIEHNNDMININTDTGLTLTQVEELLFD